MRRLTLGSVAVLAATLGSAAPASAFNVTPTACHARPEATDPAFGADPGEAIVYGYDNPNPVTESVPWGPDNIILNPPNFRANQPQVFTPGIAESVWDTFVDPVIGEQAEWVLQGGEANGAAICGGGVPGPVPGSLPTLGSGASSAAVGDVLAVGDGSFTGPAALGYAVIERCDGADICTPVNDPGNAPTSYTVAAADAGWSLRVRTVALTMDGWASALSTPVTIPGTPASGSAPTSVTSDPTADQPELLQQPTVPATAGVGEPLIADPGLWAGAPSPVLTVRWQRCDTSSCSDIPGADTSAYTPVAADVGERLRAVVTATASGLSPTYGGGPNVAETAASAPTASVTAAPAELSAPQISGVPDVGGQLSLADPGRFTGPSTTTVQWQACAGGTCEDLAGATGTSYVVTPADAGDGLRVQVTATSPGGRTVADSNALGPAGAVRSAAPPRLIGAPVRGTFVWSDGGAWVGDPGPSLSFAWQRCDAAGGDCTAISGATGPGYLPTADDVGHTLRVTITAANAFSSAASTSAPSSLVAATGARAPAALPPAHPVLSRLRARTRRFRIGPRVRTLTPLTGVARGRRGTVISLWLNEPEWLRVAVERAGSRRRTVATLTRTLSAGAHRLRFSGRLPAVLGGPLPPGRYRLQIRAFNAAGRETRPHFLRITVLG